MSRMSIHDQVLRTALINKKTVLSPSVPERVQTDLTLLCHMRMYIQDLKRSAIANNKNVYSVRITAALIRKHLLSLQSPLTGLICIRASSAYSIGILLRRYAAELDIQQYTIHGNRWVYVFKTSTVQ